MTFIPSAKVGGRGSEAAMWFAVGKRGLLVRRDETAGVARWALPLETELRELGLPLEEALHMGQKDGQDALAVSMEAGGPEASALASGWSFLGIRELVGAFDEEVFAVAGRASHLVDWMTTSRFCGRCGTPTVRVPKEWCMQCPACALTHYPRIAPAVIMLVRRGDRAILARNARFPIPFFSTLAGFSDVGETLEETVRREVFEEVGVRVGALHYFGSQPWPFPHSLMVGFTAEWESGDIRVDNDEIAEARWFSAQDLPLVPPRMSIARKLIDAWVDDVTKAR